MKEKSKKPYKWEKVFHMARGYDAIPSSPLNGEDAPSSYSSPLEGEEKR